MSGRNVAYNGQGISEVPAADVLTDDDAWRIAVATLGTEPLGCKEIECVVIDSPKLAGDYARALLAAARTIQPAADAPVAAFAAAQVAK
jgi:hypothetical protein